MSKMESEERPTKRSKLEHEIEHLNEKLHEAEAQPLETDQSQGKLQDEATAKPEVTAQSAITEEPQEVAETLNGNQEASKDSVPNSGEPGSESGTPIQQSSEATKPSSKFEIDPTLSKNQQKKLRKKLEWEAGREERKVIRKEKQKEKRERVRAEKASLPPEVLAKKEAANAHKPRPQQLPVTFLIDCDFDDLMRDGERTSLSSQITRCYSDNRNAPFRAHLTLSSFGGHLKERYDGVLEGVYKLWKGFRTFSENFKETAELAKTWMADPKENALVGSFAKYADQDQEKLKEEGEVIYLSSEGDEDLMELRPYSTYIIGGLVDKNREKGICHKRALAAGVKTKKLPIGKFMDMNSRKVLATNHVHEIMVKWLECGDWGDAFMKVIPKRKGGTLKGGRDDEDDDE